MRRFIIPARRVQGKSRHPSLELTGRVQRSRRGSYRRHLRSAGSGNGEEIGRNRQTFFVEPGKFGYRLVKGELDFPEPGTVEARCTIVESGSAVTVPLTALPLP